MTDKPQLRLTVVEAKSIALRRIASLCDDITRIGEHLQKQPAINKQMIGEINQFWAQARTQIDKGWEEIQMPLHLWEQLSRPLIAEYEAQQAVQQVQKVQQPAAPLPDVGPYPNPPAPVQAQPNGPVAEPIKKRGGWPKGKKRNPKAELTVTQ